MRSAAGRSGPSKCAWCLTADQRRYRLLDRLSGRRRMTRGQDRSRRVAAGRSAGRSTRWCIARTTLRRPVALRRGGPGADAASSPRRWPPAPAIRSTRFASAATACRRSRACRRAPGAGAAARVHRTAGAAQGRAPRHRGGACAGRSARSPSTSTVRSRPYPEYVARLQRAGGGRSAHHLSRALPARGAAATCFAATDAVVVPSVWHEVAAIVIQEAQAPGLPVIASTSGRIAGADPRRRRRPALRSQPIPAHLTRQLARLLDEPGLRAALDAAAPQPRTIDDEVDALLALYTSLGRAA